MSSLASRRLRRGRNDEEGAVINDLEKLDLNGDVSEVVQTSNDVSEVVKMRKGARVRYAEDLPARIGTESAPPICHESDHEVPLKRYSTSKLLLN